MDALASSSRPQVSSLSTLGYVDSPNRPSQSRTHTVQPIVAIQESSQHAQPQQDLWSSILNSVNSSKAISTKNIVLLGEPKSGKSSLLSALASTSPAGLISGTSSYSTSTSSSASTSAPNVVRKYDKATVTTTNASKSSSNTSTDPNDLGLAYAYFDVGDEKDKDEIVARVGAYTLHSSHPAYTLLLPFAFPEPNLNTSEQDAGAAMAALASSTISSSAAASTSSSSIAPRPSIDSLKDSIVVILLDWEQPWSFLEQLRNWLSILRELIDSAADGALTSQQRQQDTKWSKTRVALDEMKDRLEAYIRAYVEPLQKSATESSSAATTTTTTNTMTSTPPKGSTADTDTLPAPITTVSVQLDAQDIDPLAEGTLTDNLGIPIVVVCTKADAISRLERDKEFKEEQFDYIQQVLRTICMKYGAALFYTSSVRAQSIDVLRSYLLHRLFTPSSSAAQQQQQQQQQQSNDGNSGAAGAAAGGTTVFNFTYRASTTDRDTLLVPAGWDSWGKIKALREPFDCKGMAKGWENDCEIEEMRRSRKLPKTKQIEDELEKELQADRRNDGLATADETEQVQSAMKLYEDIVSDWEAGPGVIKDGGNSKGKIPDEQVFLGQHHTMLQKDPDPRSKFSKRGVVGPMTGGSDGLPSVEKYMSKVSIDSTTNTSSGAEGLIRPSVTKRESTSAAAAAAVAAMTGGGGDRNGPTSPGGNVQSGTTSPGAPKQSEVLHSFFQSLLKDKGSGIGSPKVDRLNRTNSSTNGAAKK